MKVSALATVLVPPVAIFGLLYVLVIQPERAAAAAEQERLAALRAQSKGRLLPAGGMTTVNEAEIVSQIAALLKSPAVGGVMNLSIGRGARGGEPSDGAILVTVVFEAAQKQVQSFLSSLPTSPTIFEIRSVELVPGRARAIRASVVLSALWQRSPLGAGTTPAVQ